LVISEPQASSAVTSTETSAILWLGGQSLGTLAETSSMTGGSVSTTVTAKVHSAELPAASVAVHVTVVVPTVNKLPDGGLHTTTGAGSQLSAAVTTKAYVVAPFPGDSTVVSPGHAITGGVESPPKVTLNVHVELFPSASVAVQVTAVVPVG